MKRTSEVICKKAKIISDGNSNGNMTANHSANKMFRRTFLLTNSNTLVNEENLFKSVARDVWRRRTFNDDSTIEHPSR